MILLTFWGLIAHRPSASYRSSKSFGEYSEILLSRINLSCKGSWQKHAHHFIFVYSYSFCSFIVIFVVVLLLTLNFQQESFDGTGSNIDWFAIRCCFFNLCDYGSIIYSSFDLLVGALLSAMGTQQMVGVTQEKCNQMVQLYEPSSEAKSNNQLLLDGNETI